MATSLSMVNRTEEILNAATFAFATQGVKGGSLRDIAKTAGVSLNLLNYHFGSKGKLLAAVVEAHHAVCRMGLAHLTSQLQFHDLPLSLEALVNAWIDYEFALYPTRERALSLRLLVRLRDEPEVDNVLRIGLHCAEPFIKLALQRVNPQIDRGTLDASWLMASAALYTTILNSAELRDDSEVESDSKLRQIATCFVQGGLSEHFKQR